MTSPHYLDVAISRGGGQQLITSGGHGHVPAVTKTGLLSANFLSARMAKWTLNGLLLCSALTMQWLDKCVYVYIHTYIYIDTYIYTYIQIIYGGLSKCLFPKPCKTPVSVRARYTVPTSHHEAPYHILWVLENRRRASLARLKFNCFLMRMIENVQCY